MRSISQDKRSEAIIKAEELLIQDGWQNIQKDKITDGLYFVLNDQMECLLRWIEWESEYSEWHGRSFDYPVFYIFDRKTCPEEYWKEMDETIEQSYILLASKEAVGATDLSRKASALLSDYYEQFFDQE